MADQSNIIYLWLTSIATRAICANILQYKLFDMKFSEQNSLAAFSSTQQLANKGLTSKKNLDSVHRLLLKRIAETFMYESAPPAIKKIAASILP